MSWLKTGIILLIILAVVGVGGAWYFARSNKDDVTYRTAKVTRASVVSTISSTGTLEPQEVIDVGAQVGGQIASFGDDVNGKPVDHGSDVKKGAILAKIDDSILKSDADVARAQLAAAQAGVQRAQADLKQAQAKKDQAERDWTRAQKLGPSEALAQVTYDNYRAVYETSVAAVAVADAAIGQANGAVAQAQAQVFKAERNLGYATIASPVDGQVIERRVNIGQTVNANQNAPSLFLLAKDLSHMQVWVSVNEADVGKIRAGQPVTFTVDTFAGRTFRGQVKKVRPKAEMTQNVVTYLVEVDVDNADRTLRSYLSADVNFEVARRDDVLTVPNMALRYTPPADKIAPDAREDESAVAAADKDSKDSTHTAAPTTAPSAGERPRKRRNQGDAAAVGATTTRPSGEVEWRRGTVWVRDGNYFRPIHVRAGLTDGTVTEIKGDGVTENLEVVTGEIHPDTAAAPGSTNPFGPPQFGRNRTGSGGGGGGGGGGRGMR